MPVTVVASNDDERKRKRQDYLIKYRNEHRAVLNQKQREYQRSRRNRLRDAPTTDGNVRCIGCLRELDASQFWVENTTRKKCKTCRERGKTYYKRHATPILETFKSNIHHRVLQYLKRARTKNIPVSISEARMMEIMKTPCVYCGYVSKREFGGIDRMDNELGYEEGNVVPCCSWCNYRKGAKDPVTFLEQSIHVACAQTGNDAYRTFVDAFGDATKVTHISMYKYRAKKKGWLCELIESDMKRLPALECAHCKRPHAARSWDRIDNTRGYTEDNVVPSCSACNFARRDSTIDEFYAHCKQIADHANRTGSLARFSAMPIPRTYNCRQKRASGTCTSADVSNEIQPDDRGSRD